VATTNATEAGKQAAKASLKHATEQAKAAAKAKAKPAKVEAKAIAKQGHLDQSYAESTHRSRARRASNLIGEVDVSERSHDSDQSLEQCSITAAARTIRAAGPEVRCTPTCNSSLRPQSSIYPYRRTSTRGALATVYIMRSSPLRSAYDELPCQLISMDLFCERHDYFCYHFSSDLSQWQHERPVLQFANSSRSSSKKDASLRSLPMNEGFYKLQLVRTLLPLHPWVLYLDTDIVIDKVPSTQSVESRFPFGERGDFSLLIPFQFGSRWQSSMFVVRNTEWGAAFLDHAWALREHCPDCLREQCAVNIAVFDFLVMDFEARVRAGKLPDMVDVPRPQHGSGTRFGCCEPRSYCKFPLGRDHPASTANSSRVAQSCAGNWFSASAAAFAQVRGSGPISWDPGFRNALSITHGVKTTFRQTKTYHFEKQSLSGEQGQARNCAPFSVPKLDVHRENICLLLAANASSDAEWNRLRCHTHGRANALWLAHALSGNGVNLMRGGPVSNVQSRFGVTGHS